jgi:hypothetical protein
MTAQAWTVSGVHVALGPDTIITGEAGIGSVALVRASQSGGALTAFLLAAAPPAVEPLFLEGLLVAIDGNLWSVSAGAAPVVVDVGGAYVQGAPMVGRSAEVMALERVGLPLQAVYAEMTMPADERIFFGGQLVARITATSPEQWLVLAAREDGPWLELRTLAVDLLTTPIDETAGPAVPSAWVDVAAIAPRWPGQPWIARSVRIDLGPQAVTQGAMRGLHEGPPARWQLGDVCVIVDRHTAVDGSPRLDRFAIVRGTRIGPSVLWARSAAVRYRFTGTLAVRLSHLTPPVWVVLVTPPAHVDAIAPSRVYLVIDALTRIDPSLQTGVLGVEVAVQARAGQRGWLADWVDDPTTAWQP